MTMFVIDDQHFHVREQERPLSVSHQGFKVLIMKHVRSTLEELRRYISSCDARKDLEEVDALLSMALEEVRRKLARAGDRTNTKPD